jgi:hypothetical protein
MLEALQNSQHIDQSHQVPELKIRFVSLLDSRMIKDMDEIRSLLKKKKFTSDYYEYKVTNTTFIRRLINTNSKNGLAERVMVEEKININTNLKAIRQLNWRILKDPENVLLVQLNQVKGESCCLPLIFSNIYQNDRDILVSGITKAMQVQLISKLDLNFQKIPKEILDNPITKGQILQRSRRKKGMQATARILQDFLGLPKLISAKIINIAAGSHIQLSDAEAINIILLSDLVTRYSGVLRTFQNDVSARNGSVSLFTAQFVELTQNISTKNLINRLGDYLVDEEEGFNGTISQNNSQLFSFIYKRLQHLDDKRIKIGDFHLTKSGLFNILKSMIIIARSQFDPGLWRQCLYFYKPDDDETSPHSNEIAVNRLAEGIRKQIEIHYEASSQSLMEVHLIHNIHNNTNCKRLLIGQMTLSIVELGIIKSKIAPILYKVDKNAKGWDTVRLFMDINYKSHQLIGSAHFAARAYGFLIGRRLRENVRKFLKPGLKSLLDRFNKNFFDVFYQIVISEPGLPVSRNQFADWLKYKQYFKDVTHLGYIKNTLEYSFDPLFTDPILSEKALSPFPATYSKQEFEKDYLKSRKKFLGFIEKLNHSYETTNDNSILKIFLDLIEKGHYFFNAVYFRKQIKTTKLFKILVEVINQACKGLTFKLEKQSYHNKVVIKIPFNFDPLLSFCSIFEIKHENIILTIHLIAVPVNSYEELNGLSKIVSKNLNLLFKHESNKKIQKLLYAFNIIREYKIASVDFFRYLSVIVVDRQLAYTVNKITQNTNQTPNYIKNHIPDKDKLIIGNIRDVNIGGLIQNTKIAKKEITEFENLSSGQIIQGIIYYKSANQGIRELKDLINQIQTLLDTIAVNKHDDDYNTFTKQIQKFKQLISTPIEDFSENIINLLSILSRRIQKTITRGEYNNGVLTSLRSDWAINYPDEDKKYYFYKNFISKESNQKSNLLLEIEKTRDILSDVTGKSCWIFLPDNQKEHQLQHLMEIGTFFKEKNYKMAFYINIKSLSEDRIKTLSTVFLPSNFFHLDGLKPINKNS